MTDLMQDSVAAPVDTAPTCLDPAAPGTRRRDAQATREALLHAARRRFTALGYERTSTRDVAADVGVNVALVNRYFGSKDGLLEAVLREPLPVVPELDHDRPFVETLVDMLVRGLEPGYWDRWGGQHPAMLFLRDGGSDERVRELRKQTAAHAVDKLLAMAEAGDALDATCPDRRIRAELVFALIAGTVLHRSEVSGGALAAADPAALRQPLLDAIGALLRPGCAPD
jgi:AcrR family transcriptional regulator